MLRVHFTTNAVDGTTQKEEKVTHNIKHIYIYISRMFRTISYYFICLWATHRPAARERCGDERLRIGQHVYIYIYININN
jgi:hypothetical protein